MMIPKKRSQGFSLIELLIVVTIILILAAIAIPKLLTVKQQANSTAAVSNLRSMLNALTAYASQYTAVGYPATISTIAGAIPCTPSATTACLVDDTLITNPKQGYDFYYAQASSGAFFTLSAEPANATVGQRAFCTDATDVIYYDDSGTCTVGTSPVLGQ